MYCACRSQIASSRCRSSAPCRAQAAEQLIGVMDIGFAQWRLDRLGTLTRIDLKLAPGTSPATMAQSLALPPGVALTGTEAVKRHAFRICRARIASI